MIADPATALTGSFTPEDIVRDLKHLPSAPKILPRLKQLLTDANSSMSEIVGLIRLDPAIAARVLSVGNSAYYSKGVRCFTVDEAVNRVGYGQVYDLVSYAVASQVLVRPLEVYALEADELWKRSVSCALAAESLALRTGQDRDVAYTVGLLHCLGMVAVDEWALRHQPTLQLRGSGFPKEAMEAERAALGFTQADVGASLLRSWDFPPPMCDPVRWQYAPRASAGHARMACLLHCAKWVGAVVCAPRGTARPPMPAEHILQKVPLRSGDLVGFAMEVEDKFREVSALLDVAELDVRSAHPFPNRTWAGVS